MEKRVSIRRDSRNKEFVIPILVLLIIVLSGFYIRINGLADLGLGFDEPIHIYAAKSILETGGPTLPSGKKYDRALPFTYSVALSFKLFGVNEFSARLPSVIFGILSIILIFFIGKSFFETKVGLIAAFLMAFLPFEIVWSRACRMYSMYQFFLVLGFFAFYKGFEDNNERSKLSKNSLLYRIPVLMDWNLNLLWLFFSGVALYIAFALQTQAAIFYVCVLSYLFCMFIISFINKGFRQSLGTKYFLSFLVLVILIIIGLAIPDVYRFAKRLYEFSPSWAENIRISPTAHFNFLISSHMFPVMAFFIMGTIQVCTKVNKAGFYTLTSVAITLFLHSFFASVQRPRYIYDIFPLILLISAYAMYNFFKSELRRLYAVLDKYLNKYQLIKKLSPVLLAFLLVTSFLYISPGFRNAIRIPSLQAYDFGGEYNVQWKEACQYVKNHYSPGDVIIASVPLAADYYGCGTVEYNLNNGEIDQFRKVEGNRFQLDAFSNTKAIVNLDDLKEVLLKNPRGWLILDAQRFQNPATVPKDVREFITKNTLYHTIKTDGTIFIFSWGKL